MAYITYSDLLFTTIMLVSLACIAFVGREIMLAHDAMELEKNVSHVNQHKNKWINLDGTDYKVIEVTKPRKVTRQVDVILQSARGISAMEIHQYLYAIHHPGATVLMLR